MYPEDTITIFLFPPNYEELNRRLRSRNTDDDNSIAIRKARIDEEMKLGEYFDYKIVNNRLEETVEQVRKLIKERVN